MMSDRPARLPAGAAASTYRPGEPAAMMERSPGRRGHKVAPPALARRWRWILATGLLLVAGAAGAAAGLVATAFGAALAGRALWNATGEQAQLVLAAGPLLALAPMVALLWTALHQPPLARWMGVAVAIWASVAIATLWLGLRSLMR